MALMEDDQDEEEEHEIPPQIGGKNPTQGKPAITDKEFYKQMQKLKDRGTNAVPPKKSASAYIIFGK